MKYELSDEEAKILEKYRDLFPEFQAALLKEAQILFELQRNIVKDAIAKG